MRKEGLKRVAKAHLNIQFFLQLKKNKLTTNKKAPRFPPHFHILLLLLLFCRVSE